MNIQEQTKLVQQAYSYFKSGDIESLLSLFSPDITWQLPEIEHVPFSGKRKGLEQVREFFNTLATAQDVLEFNPVEYVSQDDKVVALGQYKWKVKESGKQFGSEFAHVFTVRNGKITEFHEFMDTAAVTAAYHRELIS